MYILIALGYLCLGAAMAYRGDYLGAVMCATIIVIASDLWALLKLWRTQQEQINDNDAAFMSLSHIVMSAIDKGDILSGDISDDDMRIVKRCFKGEEK